MVHIHLPKPPHGWRDVIGEIGVIVIGILIALGAENLIERWHWHEQGEHTREVMKQELFNSARNAYERLAIRQCLRSRLTTLFDGLKTSKGSWTGSPYRFGGQTNLFDVAPPAYLLPNRPYTSDAWKNALASGVVNHMSREDVASYSDLYSMFAALDYTQAEEAVAAANLAPLSLDLRLDDTTRVQMIATVAQVDRTTALMNIISGQYLRALSEMRLGFDVQETQKERTDILKRLQERHGACVQALPLDLG